MHGFFEHQYLRYKKKHISNLVALARIDDDLHDAEIDFIYKVGRKYGLKDKQITQILNSEEKMATNIPEGHEERIKQLFDLVDMMLADGIVEAVEREFCNDIAQKYGFGPGVVQKIMEYIQKYQYPREDWEHFLEEVKQHSL